MKEHGMDGYLELGNQENGPRSNPPHPSSSMRYFEAWWDSPHPSKNGKSIYGKLEENELEDFLDQKGRFKGTSPRPFSGGIRMLVCNHQGNLLRFTVSKSSYDRIAESFKLHDATISTLELYSGTYSKFATYDTDDSSKLRSLSIILNVPRNWEIAVYGMSITFDVATKTTTALFAGEDACSNWDNTQIQGLHSFLEEHSQHWQNPLLLPWALITDHWIRLQPLVSRLTWTMHAIEQDLGVAKVARPKAPEFSFWTAENASSMDPFMAQLPRARVRDLTVSINTQYTRVLFCKRSPIWHSTACRFMLGFQKELGMLLGADATEEARLREILEHQLHSSQSLESHIDILESRVNVQLNILYSIVAQTDNQLSARLAAAAGRDSTSMKILALITVIFLPGTFVATLFSMSMFDWNDGSSNAGSGKPVSPRFWVYWATTIPLTVATLLILGLWWNYEKRKFDSQLEQVLVGAEELPRSRSRINSTLDLFPTAKTFLSG